MHPVNPLSVKNVTCLNFLMFNFIDLFISTHQTAASNSISYQSPQCSKSVGTILCNLIYVKKPYSYST